MDHSDDDYDRKRSGNFRGGRDNFNDRNNPFRGGGSGGRGRGTRDRFGSPGREMPPAKRMRSDWSDNLRGPPRYDGNDNYSQHYAAQAYGGHAAHMRPHHQRGGGESFASSGETQPALLTLRQYLDTQDDSISESELLNKYTTYKLEFKSQQLNKFFVTHKDEEWFRNKYHPSDSVKRKEEHLGFIQKRVVVFNELLESGKLKPISVDIQQTDPLIRLLDTVVIKLEGGTEEDLKILDKKPKDIIFPDRTNYERSYGNKERDFDKRNKQDDDVEDEPKLASPRPIKRAATRANSDDEENWDVDGKDEPKLASPLPIKRAAVRSYSDDEENWDDDGKDEPKLASPRPIKRAAERADCEENWDDRDDAVPVAAVSAIKTTFGNSRNWTDNKKDDNKKNTQKSYRRKRTSSDSSSSSSSDSDSSSSSSSDDDEDDEKIKERYGLEEVKSEQPEAEAENEAVKVKEEVIVAVEEKEKDIATNPTEDAENKQAEVIENNIVETVAVDQLKNGVTTDVVEAHVDKTTDRDEVEEEAEKNGESVEKPTAEVKGEETSEIAIICNPEPKVDDDQLETIDLDKENDGPQPRALHRTSSVFLRNLAPSITRSEIIAICQRFDGYLRVAIADPLVERRWYQRGWATFKHDANIKEVCSELNKNSLRNCEMGAIINRDLSRRVRFTTGITTHKTIVRADIKLCAKVIMNFDERMNLWCKPNYSVKDEDIKPTLSSVGSATYGFQSNNPVLQNIADFLIEEASAEEEELLGISSGNKDTDGDSIQRDPELIAVLDNLILYLRIVHSVDFYNHCEYPYEDEMPNRCGVIHARGSAPLKISDKELQDYNKNFESKMQQFLGKTTSIELDELKSLGSRDPDAEVEKFIEANTQELAKEKWLCPLSGKKFKGPEFIRKHIFSKHVDKVDEVRKEVEFFNNYLKDPKRPQLPEHPRSTKRTNSVAGAGYRPPIYPPAYAHPYAAYAPPVMLPGPGFGEHRQIIQYRDLDASPHDPFDMFN